MKSKRLPAVRLKPHIYADRLAALSPAERTQLRALLDSKLFLKLMNIVECMKPSANGSKMGSGERDAHSLERAGARLSEIKGWELHQVAIFLALNEPPQVKEALQETFPDEGRADAAWNGQAVTAAPESPTATHRRR